MALKFSVGVLEKLGRKHQVTAQEVEECFLNRTGTCIQDVRAEHRTTPPTWWFVAPTDVGRELKVVFVERDGDIHIKTAYPPEPAAKRIYEESQR